VTGAAATAARRAAPRTTTATPAAAAAGVPATARRWRHRPPTPHRGHRRTAV